jgi:hypothetical protein
VALDAKVVSIPSYTETLMSLRQKYKQISHVFSILNPSVLCVRILNIFQIQ